MFRSVYKLAVGVLSMCSIWTSHNVLMKNEGSGKEKQVEKVILYIFTSNLHILSQSVWQIRKSYLQCCEITIVDFRYVKKLTSYLKTTIAPHSLT